MFPHLATIIKVALIGAALALGAPLLLRVGYFIWLVYHEAEDACGLQLAQEVWSPDHTRRAVLYQFDCGATTPFTTQVSILREGEPLPHRAGNVFSAYHGSHAGSWRGPYTDLGWLNNQTLLLSYVADAAISQQQPTHDGVSIRYRPVPLSELP